MNQESNIPSHDAHSEVAKPAFDARAHLDAIIGSSEDAIIGEDLTGIIVSWNESASRIFGYSAN